jgi:hypothetical protein
MNKYSTFQTLDLPWRVWRLHSGGRSQAGDYHTRAEADRAISRQLRPLSPGSAFQVEFIGEYMGGADTDITWRGTR